MQKKYRIINKKLEETQEDPCVVTAFLSPSEDERKHLIEDLKIDEHTLNSALDPDELSRVEFEPAHIAVIYSIPRHYSSEDGFLFKGGSVGAFLFKDRLILVVAEDLPLIDKRQHFRAQSPTSTLLTFLMGAILHFRGHLKGISAISDELQDKINTAMENKHLIHLFTLEKSLVYYLSFIHSNGLLLEKLKNNANKIGFTIEDLELLDDLIIENMQCLKQAEIFSNIIASLMDARASIVGNNLNYLMRTLMIITLSVMVPSLVVALFSMNVPLPLQSLPWAFWLILTIATVSALAVLFMWLGRKPGEGRRWF